MNEQESLTKLLAKVKAGDTLFLDGDFVAVFGVFGPPNQGNTWMAYKAYNGDLNAAKELHEAVVPEWRVTHAFGLISGEMATFNLTHNEKISTYVSAKSVNPARAWLIAIIEALIATSLQGVTNV
jgi:hypothetical protein